jgi:hypothetical protein
VVLGVVLLASACGGISRTELDEESQARGGGIGETLPLEGLDAIEAEIGEDVRFTSMNLSRDSMSVTVLHPGNNDELDSWIYQSNGSLIGPDPVNGAPPADELARILMDPDVVALDQMDEIVDDALERTDFEGGYAQNVGIRRSQGERARITVSVTSPRHSAEVVYRGDGRPIEGQS